MKSQFSTQSEILFQPSVLLTSTAKDFSHLTCLNNSKAHCICINSICAQESAIMCADVNCSCRKMHESCIIVQMQSVLKAIQVHAQPLKHFENKVSQFFQSTIDKLSVIRDDLISKHRQLFERKSYSPYQFQFISLLQANSLKQIKGTLVSQITSKINNREAINKLFNSSSEQLQKISNKMTNYVDSLSSQVEKVLIQLQRQFTSEKNFAGLNEPYLFSSSQVITTHQQQKVLKQFFTDTIFEATLLYRASEHQFNGEMFHKLCENIPNILVLVKTSFGKQIGGYTPLGFSSTQRDVYLNDPQMKSFLFSLTEGDKLQLKSQQNAIMNEKNQDYVLRFGGGSDLRISNHADQNILSYAAISTTYKNQKYNSNTDGYRKFTGSDTIYFKVTEWEVWKLTLD